MSISGLLHKKLIYSRRMERLSGLLSKELASCRALEKGTKVLDLGCGDGKIDSIIMKRMPTVSIEGIDILVRDMTYIPVTGYDGQHIPFEDDSFDVIMVVDVLHHTDDPAKVFKEICRVSAKYIVIKDHIRTGLWSYIKLKMMDHVGNAHYHVRSPYNYLDKKQWEQLFDTNRLEVRRMCTDLELYTGVFHLLFDRKLHFIATLEKLSC